MNRCELTVVLACLTSACSLYDGGLLSPSSRPLTPTAGRAGTPPGTAGSSGAGGTGGVGGMGGRSGAGGSGGSAGSAGGRAMTSGCGDGRVAAGEKCDTGITAGQPGACPIECPTLTDCIPRRLEGAGCQAECIELMQVCMNGDECCPSGCNNATDADCSASCGDGLVQEGEGETCEPEAEGDDACKTQDDCEAEDDDPCTTDRLNGEAENCTATCTHEKITALVPDDGCCLPDSNANTDNDCDPRCGNGVREGNEACDGGEGCDDECRITRTAEQEACIEDASLGPNDECAICACTVCTAQMKACRDSGNENRDMRCTEVADCANEESCAGDVCYCGDFPDRVGCALWGNGPCKPEVERAAGSTDPVRVEQEGADPDTALGRARALGDCTVRNCDDACRD